MSRKIETELAELRNDLSQSAPEPSAQLMAQILEDAYRVQAELKQGVDQPEAGIERAGIISFFHSVYASFQFPHRGPLLTGGGMACILALGILIGYSVPETVNNAASGFLNTQDVVLNDIEDLDFTGLYDFLLDG